jgi:hypothetical protein
MIIDLSLVDNIEVDGIDYSDYPDFCDAFIGNADYNGEPMSDYMVDYINENYPDYVYEQVINKIF